MNERILNLFGAFGLAVSDAQSAICARHGIHPSDVAALNALGSFPGLTVGALAPVIGITRSAAVRLVDRLVAADLVSRNSGKDRREVHLALTAKGRAIREAFLADRASMLAVTIGHLTELEVETLTEVLERSLARLTRGRDSADHICRLCEEEVCPAATCPVECAVPNGA